MPGPYINQAPVDDSTDDRDGDERPTGTDPQTMAILARILSLLEAQTAPPPMPGPPPGMGGPGADLSALMPPGAGAAPPMSGPGMPPPMPGPGMGGPPPPMGPPPGMPPGMPPPPGGPGGMPFTQYAQQRMMRPPLG